MDEHFNMNEIIGRMDILFITLDTLRYDVADKLFKEGLTPCFKKYFPKGWERCHSPGSFTYAAHQAFFAGFLPTPATPGRHSRLFAANFQGSETTTENTLVFDTEDIVSGLAGKGYRTICIGGVGFFNKQTALGKVLPQLFQESYWEEKFGVTEPRSAEYQFDKAIECIESSKKMDSIFMFINVSALHQPNKYYLSEANEDSLESHSAALQYVDTQLPKLLSAFQKKRDTFCIICSDHGTAYGEDGYTGHRIGHSTVWEVPLATFIVNKEETYAS
jgi:hypothetical protein